MYDEPSSPAPAPLRRFTPGVALVVLLGLELGWLCGAPAAESLSYAQRGWPTLGLVLIAVSGLSLLGVWFTVAAIRRRKFQFGLRTFLLLIVCAAIPLARLARGAHQARRFQALQASLFDAGVIASSDDLTAGSEFPWRFGFQSAESLLPPKIYGIFVTPQPLEIHGVLSSNRLPVEHFETLATLQFLTLSEVQDAETPRLGRLKNLKYLHLSGPLTDAGLSFLTELRELEFLNLPRTHVTGPGLCFARELPRLHSASLASSACNDDGLRVIATLQQLTYLNLSGTRITDQGLPHLAKLKYLEELNLADTAVEDAGIEALSNLKSLQQLDLSQTKVTSAGLTRLAEALPSCCVISSVRRQ